MEALHYLCCGVVQDVPVIFHDFPYQGDDGCVRLRPTGVISTKTMN